MASTFAGGTSSQTSSMLGFGPAATPPFFASSGEQQSQRLQQYYQSPQRQQPAPAMPHTAERPSAPGRRSGKVKFFDTQKGFGFINDNRPEELNNEEVFVHYTSISAKSGFRSLAEGEDAEYDVVRGGKGFQAANVTGPGGAQVIGDNRRNHKNTFMPISPYAAMYPYMHQDPTAFFAGASPYAQHMMLMPPTDYRNPAPAHHHHLPISHPHHPQYASQHPQAHHIASASAGAYRNVSPYSMGNPSLSPYGSSPYSSPGPLRDIGKDFGSMAFGGLSMEDSFRDSKPQPSTGGTGGAPFGGMFGSIPSFDSSVRPGPANAAAAAAFNQQPATNTAANNGAGSGISPSGAVSARSGSLDSGDARAGGSGNAASGAGAGTGAARDDSSSNNAGSYNRPQASHTRSSSLLYGSTGKPNAPQV